MGFLHSAKSPTAVAVDHVKQMVFKLIAAYITVTVTSKAFTTWLKGDDPTLKIEHTSSSCSTQIKKEFSYSNKLEKKLLEQKICT